MRYLPHTDEEIRAMLARVGVEHIDDLFEAIPAAYRLGRDLELEPRPIDIGARSSHSFVPVSSMNTRFDGCFSTGRDCPPTV